MDLDNQQSVPDKAKLTDEEIWDNWYQGSGFETQMKTFPLDKLDQRDSIMESTRKMIIDNDRISSDAATEKAWLMAWEQSFHARDDEFDAYYDEVSRLKMELAHIKHQAFDEGMEYLDPLVAKLKTEVAALQQQVGYWETTADIEKQLKDAAKEQVWALVEAAEVAAVYGLGWNDALRAAIASAKEAQDA